MKKIKNYNFMSFSRLIPLYTQDLDFLQECISKYPSYIIHIPADKQTIKMCHTAIDEDFENIQHVAKQDDSIQCKVLNELKNIPYPSRIRWYVFFIKPSDMVKNLLLMQKIEYLESLVNFNSKKSNKSTQTDIPCLLGTFVGCLEGCLEG
jgi:hypothetical protein